jgi:alkylhydroperoxidase/carboxymuconolactone decarboxylase family protein YurZ
MGEAFVANALGNATVSLQPIHSTSPATPGRHLATARLELKTRSLVTVAMLIMLGKQHEPLLMVAPPWKRFRKCCCTPASTVVCRRCRRRFQAEVRSQEGF